MGGLYFLLPTLLVVLISFLVVRAAAIALMLTGMDERRARFQALSAFSGTGFTTREAESVVNHPVRRRVVTWLMVLGNAGIVTVIVTATSSLVTSKGFTLPINVAVLLLGIYVIYRLATRRGLMRKWERFIESELAKSPVFEEGATEDLLHLIEGYGLVRAVVGKNSPLTGCSVADSRVSEKGLVVLGIERGRNWISVPMAKEPICEGDRLVVYGPLDVLRSLFRE